VAERTVPRAAQASPETAPNGDQKRASSRKGTGAPAPRRTRARKSANPQSRSGRTVNASTHHTRIIAVANQKGGVGKSTTAVSLGAALAEAGKRVLVVDLDPQGNASTGLGIRHEAREITVYDVLAAEAPIEGAIVPTPVDRLFAIPSTIDLAGAEIELVSQFSRELRLRRALEPLRQGDYDFILLDCPPSLGLLTVNALAAAEELIVPIQCEYYALEGLGQLLRNVRLVQQNVNQQLRLTGIVMTMFDPRTKLSEQVVQEVRRYFGDRVYETIIPRTVRLSEAPGFGQPITVYDPRSRGAQRYRDLAKEVVSKLPAEGPLPMLDDLPSVILPEAEAPPARAPRPLVRDDDLDETSAPADDEGPVQASKVEAAEGTGEPEPAPDLHSTTSPDDPAPHATEQGLERSVTLGELEVEDAEPSGSASQEATRDGAAADEPHPVVEAEPAPPPVGVAAPRQDAPETEDGAERRVDAPAEAAEPESDGDRGERGPEAATEGKRRWSLFRRGESR
jgi:chromosome partitioning protein